ncbi:MAG: phosphoglycerate mutase [Acidimicrobiaceae bacterium]|nr:phosphoglycerate mutase [Acidimicrobiaceae bacterium]|tara:strand:+ start:173 stop:844 length:672 start_codon:yes stop_codon:yes gene_type:complete
MVHENKTRLILIRHGESNVTVERILGGEKSCTGLSDLGRDQASALRERLEKEAVGVDVLYASTMPRAIETAEIIKPALKVEDLLLDSELVEHRPGDADGKPYDELEQIFGLNDYYGRPHVSFAPDAESLQGFHFRVSLALENLIAKHVSEVIMVVCHGGVIDVAIRQLLDLPRRGQFDLWTLNTSLTEFVVDDTEAKRGRWTLIRYNDHAHLAGLPFATNEDP